MAVNQLLVNSRQMGPSNGMWWGLVLMSRQCFGMQVQHSVVSEHPMNNN